MNGEVIFLTYLNLKHDSVCNNFQVGVLVICWYHMVNSGGQ